jgi:hypothetical protein
VTAARQRGGDAACGATGARRPRRLGPRGCRPTRRMRPREADATGTADPRRAALDLRGSRDRGWVWHGGAQATGAVCGGVGRTAGAGKNPSLIPC